MNAQKKEKSSKDLTFEEAFERLAKIVDQLESGEANLTEMTRLFEEGIHLSRFCSDQLEAVEQRVEVLMGETENEVEPFDSESEESRD